MQGSASVNRIRFSSALLVVSGVLFLVYPALRPFSDEASLQGAGAFGSAGWLVAHMLAMVAFTLLPLGFLGLHSTLQETRAESLGYGAVVFGALGAGLTLPFYGAEAFGLHAIGQEAVRLQSLALLDLAATVRSGAGLVMFMVGLLLLAVAALTAAVGIWRSGRYSRWSGIPLAVGMFTYIPQFLGAQPLRVAHGLLVALGCIWVAAGLWKNAVRPAHAERRAHHA